MVAAIKRTRLASFTNISFEVEHRPLPGVRQWCDEAEVDLDVSLKFSALRVQLPVSIDTQIHIPDVPSDPP